jgi:hypothetical protein
MLNPVYRGQVAPIRRNLFNVLFVVDLSTPLGLSGVTEALDMIKDMTPVRFGLVPLISGHGVSHGIPSASVSAFYKR